MKKVLFLAAMSMLFLVPLASLEAEGSGNAAVYNPGIAYYGHHDTTAVYYSTSKGERWKQLRKLDRLSYITCQEAIDQLKNTGVWRGALEEDGSCLSSDEPADWAMGNWLNYLDSTGSAGR